MESGWIEETTVVEVYMYVIEKEEETTEEEETERVEDDIIISDEVDIAHYIFNKSSITAQTIGKILIIDLYENITKHI